jgi:hypothetical protein
MNNVPPDCPLCRANNLLTVPVLAESGSSYLLEATGNTDCFLIIPTAHIEGPDQLPDTWWADVKALLPQVPDLTPDFNVSFNFGHTAGQTLEHIHLWVIRRRPHEPASGKGLALLISERNKE